jgi:hypothetical protein
MQKSGNLRVLFVTTWAFTACFAVWTMFGVTGIRPLRRTGHYAALAGGLCHPIVDLHLRERALAVFAAGPCTRAGRRLLLGWHAICRTFLSKREPWVRHGILWRRHHGCGAQHVRRPISGDQLRLAICAEGLRGRSPRNRGIVLHIGAHLDMLLPELAGISVSLYGRFVESPISEVGPWRSAHAAPLAPSPLSSRKMLR